MKGVREPLLWIALASLATCLPAPQLVVPACASLALSIQVLLRTRIGEHARRALHLARLAAWLACALNALLLTPLAAGLVVLAILSVPLALLALANALRRLAWVGGVGDEDQWFSAVRLLFAGALLAGCLRPDIAVGVQFLTAPVLAFLVLRFRRRFPLEIAR